jgi:hypothetical protein
LSVRVKSSTIGGVYRATHRPACCIIIHMTFIAPLCGLIVALPLS